MKNRQFITLLLIVILGFIFLNYKIDKLQSAATNIDENVATVDERIVRKIQPGIEDIQDKMYEIEKEIGKIKESITWHMGDIEEKLFYLVSK